MIEEFGNVQQKEEKAEETVVKQIDELVALGGHRDSSDEDRPGLVQQEERLTGAVSWKTYGLYFHYAGRLSWAPLILILTGLMQGTPGTRNWLLIERTMCAHECACSSSCEQPLPRFLDRRKCQRVYPG